MGSLTLSGDIYNCDLKFGDMVRYRTKSTTSGIFDTCDRTNLVQLSDDTQAVIKWKAGKFQIGADEKDWAELRIWTIWLACWPKSGDEGYCWRWNNSTYDVLFQSGRWTAAQATRTRDRNVIKFIPRKKVLSFQLAPGKITFVEELPQDEALFVILVLLFSEMERQKNLSVKVFWNLENAWWLNLMNLQKRRDT